MEYLRVPVPLIQEVLDKLKQRGKYVETSALVHVLIRGLDSHISGFDMAQASTKEEIVEIVKILRESTNTLPTQDKSILTLNLNATIGKIKSAVMQFFQDTTPILVSEERATLVKEQQDHAFAQVEEMRRRQLEEEKRKLDRREYKKKLLVAGASMARTIAPSSTTGGPIAEGPFKIVVPPVSSIAQPPPSSSSLSTVNGTFSNYPAAKSSTAAASATAATNSSSNSSSQNTSTNVTWNASTTFTSPVITTSTSSSTLLSNLPSSTSDGWRKFPSAATNNTSSTVTSLPLPSSSIILQPSGSSSSSPKFVIVLVGLPGSGKTYISNLLVEKFGHERAESFCQDILGTHTAVRRNALAALTSGVKSIVIIDRTNWTIMQRQTWTSLAKETNAICISVELRRDVTSCINRCELRADSHSSYQPGAHGAKFPLDKPRIITIVNKFASELQPVSAFAEGFNTAFVSNSDGDVGSLINAIFEYVNSGGAKILPVISSNNNSTSHNNSSVNKKLKQDVNSLSASFSSIMNPSTGSNVYNGNNNSSNNNSSTSSIGMNRSPYSPPIVISAVSSGNVGATSTASTRTTNKKTKKKHTSSSSHSSSNNNTNPIFPSFIPQQQQQQLHPYQTLSSTNNTAAAAAAASTTSSVENDQFKAVANMLRLDVDTVRDFYEKNNRNWSKTMGALQQYHVDLEEAKQMDQVRLVSESTAVEDKRRAKEEEMKALMSLNLVSKFNKSELMKHFSENMIRFASQQTERQGIVKLLEVEEKAIKWWSDNARAYARSRKIVLTQPLTVDVIRNEIQQWETALYAMPDTPNSAPTAFAKCLQEERDLGLFKPADVVEVD
jgi:hypothetical protein